MDKALICYPSIPFPVGQVLETAYYQGGGE